MSTEASWANCDEYRRHTQKPTCPNIMAAIDDGELKETLVVQLHQPVVGVGVLCAKIG